MLSLDARLSSLNLPNQMEEFKKLLDTAQVKTTFWGSRVVEVNGFSGSVYLDDVARKIINQRSDANDLLPTKQMARFAITEKLRGFYNDSDTKIQNSNFFTKFLNWIREFSLLPYTPRFYIET
ncbi:MAG: hypothetical protein H7A37_00590 [Chlamydiales bacterium]|nr:hypothetical protein [Chlamydiia bacterium]MCP5506789.1 hypothetical protein [Chlamydiales bacterium]